MLKYSRPLIRKNLPLNCLSIFTNKHPKYLLCSTKKTDNLDNPFLQEYGKYPSINNYGDQKLMGLIYEKQLHRDNVLWIATEKINGSNFTIYYDLRKNTVKYGRRTSFISKDIPIPVYDIYPFMTENFYEVHKLVGKFHNNLQRVRQNVLRKYPNSLSVHIYGQLFGGLWPNNVKCKMRIGNGVYYTPNHEFLVFDILIRTQQGQFWVNVLDIPEVLQNCLIHVPVYFRGTFHQIQKLDTKFDSTIPLLLGLGHLENNVCQGLIIRPNKTIIYEGQRLVLKRKNEKFRQKSQTRISIQQRQKSQENKLQYLREFLNSNRIESAISKYPDFKNQNHLTAIIVQDILIDVVKNQYKVKNNNQSIVNKRVRKLLDKIVLGEVIEYIKKQRTQFVQRLIRKK